MTPPLRLVVKRDTKEEILECGHVKASTYRKARRRRCLQCLTEAEIATEQPLIEPHPEPSNQPRCAYCHDDLDNKVTACNECRTILHQDCAKELGRCPILGCNGTFSKKNTTIALTPRNIVINLRRPEPVKSLISRLWDVVSYLPRKFWGLMHSWGQSFFGPFS